MKRAITCASAALALLAGADSLAGGAAAKPDRLQRVIAAQQLRVCIWPEYYGVTYRSPKTQQLSGIDIDISAALAQELGVRLKYVDSSFAQLFDNLLHDHCDIAMHAVGVTAERRARLQFTQPHLRSDMYAITTRRSTLIKTWDDLDQPDRVIAVQAGTVMVPVMQQRLAKARLMVVQPPMTRENEVESGRADAFISDYAYSQRMLETTDWARVVAPKQVFHQTDYAYALAPDDTSLLTRVNEFMASIKKDNRLQQFARRHRLEPMLIETTPAGRTDSVTDRKP